MIEYENIVKELTLKNKEINNNLTILQEELNQIKIEREMMQN